MANRRLAIGVVAAVLVTTGCFDSGSPTFETQFSEIIPSPEQIELRVPGDPNPNALTLGETALFYSQTYRISHGINGTVYGILSVLRDVVSYPPTHVTENEAIWGPFTPALEPTSFTVVVRQVGDNDYEYAVLARPRTSTTETDWTPIIAGQAQPVNGSLDGEGSGRFMVYWTTFASMNPNLDLVGTMTVDYSHAGLQWRTVEMYFEDFVDRWSGPSAEPTDVLYRYVESADTSGDFQFAYQTNVHRAAEGRPEPETVRIRSRWSAGGAGRSDVRISSDEIGADLATFLGLEQDYVSASEGWDDGFLRTYYNESPVRLTDDDGEPGTGSVDGPGQGSQDDCVFGDSLFVDGDIDVM